MKPIKSLIIVLVIIAILTGGFIWLLNTEPQDNTDDPFASFEPSATITIFSTEKTNIKDIVVTNAGESYTLTQKNSKWVVNNDETIKILQNKADTLAYECSSVVVKMLVAENVTDFSPYGLDKTNTKVKFTLNDGQTKTVLVGNMTADKGLYYVMLEGDNKVYAKSITGVESLVLPLEKLRDTSLYSVGDDDLKAFTIAKRGAKEISITLEKEIESDGTEKSFWKMKSPIIKLANEYSIGEQVIPLITSLVFDKVASNEPGSLKEFGLDKPYAVYTVTDSNATYKVSVGNKTEGGRFVMISGSKAIYVVAESKISFVDMGYIQLVDKLIHVEYIEDVKNIIIDGNNEKIELSVSGGYKINNLSVDEDTFKSSYQTVLSIMLDDFTETTSKPSGKAAYTITYYKLDGSNTTVSFYDWDDRNYIVLINGEGNMLCRKKQVTNMIASLGATVK